MSESVTLVMALSACAGGVWAYAARRLPIWARVVLAPAFATASLSAAWFAWIAVTTAVYGHPAGHSPLAVATGATFLVVAGLVVFGSVPAIIGCAVSILTPRLLRRKR